MQNNEPLKFLFVINPVSGGKEKRDWETTIRETFRDIPHSMEFFLLTGKSDAASVEHHINSVKPDRVIGVGGDGTIKMVAEQLKGTRMSLGIIPAGSANGMAKELGIPLDVNAALEIVLNGESRLIDAVQINEEICLHLSDIGMNAMLVKYFEKSKKRGMWGYGQAIARVLWEKQLMDVSLRIDSGHIRRKAFMVVLANARTYGTGAVINPEGTIDDGEFEIVVVKKVNVLEVLKTMTNHKPFHPNRIEVFKTKNLELTTKRRAYFQVDGEYLGKTKKVSARIMPRCIRVMLAPKPEETPAA